MDFCSFPKHRRGYNRIFVIVDCFSKRYISLPCYKATSAGYMAKLFIKHVIAGKVCQIPLSLTGEANSSQSSGK